jgi:hypothetical protein
MRQTTGELPDAKPYSHRPKGCVLPPSISLPESEVFDPPTRLKRDPRELERRLTTAGCIRWMTLCHMTQPAPGVLHVLDERNPNEDADPDAAKYGPSVKVAPRVLSDTVGGKRAETVGRPNDIVVARSERRDIFVGGGSSHIQRHLEHISCWDKVLRRNFPDASILACGLLWITVLSPSPDERLETVSDGRQEHDVRSVGRQGGLKWHRRLEEAA